MDPNKNGAKRSQETGFTLIEVLVALAVTGMLLGALMQAYSSGLRTLHNADRLQTASLIAASLLDETAALALEPGSEGGELQGFSWRRDIAEAELAELPPAGERLWRPLIVTVEVSWDKERSVTVSSLRLGQTP